MWDQEIIRFRLFLLHTSYILIVSNSFSAAPVAAAFLKISVFVVRRAFKCLHRLELEICCKMTPCSISCHYIQRRKAYIKFQVRISIYALIYFVVSTRRFSPISCALKTARELARRRCIFLMHFLSSPEVKHTEKILPNLIPLSFCSFI